MLNDSSCILHSFSGAGCPELVSTTAQSTLQTYLKPNALSAKAVGEGAYRLAIDPKPKLRNFIMSDTEWAKYMPVVCRQVLT